MPENSIEKLKQFAQKYMYTSLFGIILTVCIYYNINGYQFVYPIINVVVVIMLFALSAKTKAPFSYLLAFILAIIVSIDTAFSIQFQSYMGIGNVTAAMESNMRESSEFMQGKALIVYPTCFVVTLFFSYKMLGELKQTKWSKKIIAASLAILITLTTTYLLQKEYSNKDKQNPRQRSIMDDQPVFFAYTLLSPRFVIILPSVGGLCFYLEDLYTSAQNKNSNRVIPQGLQLDNSLPTPTTIYLVIGESSCRNHYSLYGYPIKTTPFLDSLATADSTTFDFYNGISPASLTRNAIRFAMSFATHENRDAFFTEKNVVEMAKESGYETIWISNHDGRDLQDYYPAIVAKSSDFVYFFVNDADKNQRLDDLNIIDMIKKKRISGKKQLITLNLSGSHIDYKTKYDQEDDAYFKQNKLPENNYSDYDKSIHHTDRFFEALTHYTMRNDSNSVIIYFSDHGEIVNVGHGLINEGKSQFEIPLFFINNKTEVPIKTIMDKYVTKNNKLLNTINIPYIMSEIMGYKVDNNLVKKAVEEGEYIYHSDNQIYKFSEITN